MTAPTRILGCDQALNATGLCLLVGDKPQTFLTLRTRATDDADRRMDNIAVQVAQQVTGHGVELLVLEEPYIPTWVRGRKLAAMAREALVLRELGGKIEVAARLAGAQVMWVSPPDGFKALTGSRRGAKAGHVRMAQAYLRSYGLVLEDGEDHIADALGLALAGSSRARFGEAQP